jgi:hypothetical protein
MTIPASKDNTIFQSNVNNSAGGAAAFYSGTNNVASPRRGLLAFDVAGNVPAGRTITDVQLKLYLALSPNSSNQTIGLHRLNADWGEGTAGSSTPGVGGTGNGFAASAGDATWNERFFGSAAWTNPGATGDFTPVASASSVVGGPVDSPHTWLSTAALVNDVHNWLDAPANNFGWALINANEAVVQTFKAFYSRSSTQNSGAWRPALTITYIPEPSAAVLLLLASLIATALPRR